MCIRDRVYTGCLAGMLLWHAAARRRVHWLVWVQLAVCAANALYAATCPGTASRIAGETTSWFTDFGMRTVWQNAELGISNAMYHVPVSYTHLDVYKRQVERGLIPGGMPQTAHTSWHSGADSCKNAERGVLC